jgi:hypothetical protein
MDFANQNEGKYIHVRSDVRKPYVIIWLWRNQKHTMPIHWLLNGGWLPNQHSTFSGGTWDNMLYSAVSRYWRSFTWLAKTHLKAIQSHVFLCDCIALRCVFVWSYCLEVYFCVIVLPWGVFLCDRIALRCVFVWLYCLEVCFCVIVLPWGVFLCDRIALRCVFVWLICQ